MHMVLMTLGNIRKAVCRGVKRNAYILLAEIPSPKFKNTEFPTKTEEQNMPGILRRQLFHHCMSIVLQPLRRHGEPARLYRAIDADGNTRKCTAILAGWIADMEEIWAILGIGHGTCPKCLATHENLDSPCEQPARTSRWILDTLLSICHHVTSAADTWQFATRAKELGLFGIEKLCWEGIDGDMCRIICFDILHTVHKAFFDHLFTWVRTTIETNDLDNGLKAQPHSIRKRNFGRGISHLSQLSGCEHRNLQRHILPAILGHPNSVPQVQRAVHAFLDFSYKVQFPVHSDASLDLISKDIATFYRNYKVFIVNGSRDLPHMKIPKLHYLRHTMSDIKYLGALDGLSTETMETLHRLVKDAYPLTNQRNFMAQIICLLEHTEAVRLFSRYLQDTSHAPAQHHGDGDCDDGGDQDGSCDEGSDEDGTRRNKGGDEGSDCDRGNREADGEDDSTARSHDSGTMPQDMGRLVGPDIHLGGQSLGGVIYKCPLTE